MKAAELIEDLFSDAGKARRRRAEDVLASFGIKLVVLNKDGTENKSVTATKRFRNKQDAIDSHNLSVKLNPHREIAHNLYIENDLGKFKLTLRGHHEGKKS